jgi:hypothetical protein
MFTKKNDSALQTAINRAVKELADHKITSDEYATIVNHLCKMQELENKNSRSLDPNAMIAVAANLTGILMIIHHEHVNVITSKALSFVKLR